MTSGKLTAGWDMLALLADTCPAIDDIEPIPGAHITDDGPLAAARLVDVHGFTWRVAIQRTTPDD